MNILNDKMTNESTSVAIQPILTAEDTWMLHVREVIQQGIFQSDLSVRWVADACHFSERHFSRKVRLLTGHPPSKLILETKLIFALKLLKNKRATTVKEVAAMLHFSDVKYFSRRFQQRFGHYPSQCFQS
jgi:AraC-like DNA-binding protein